ncbi:MAG TPA: TIGR02757 family protein [Chitinophagaceae bacterium]|nr:TIGR02757 family protein [Chitinophagaceae bacterium]
MREKESLKDFFDKKVFSYSNKSFIVNDPVCIPHLFTKKQDIEIAAFFAAIFAWGNRTTIINKSRELMQGMDMSPHQFCLDPSTAGLKRLKDFKHRTFNADDLYYFIHFFQYHYRNYSSLETAFTMAMDKNDENIEKGLIGFRQYFFSLEHMKRTEKHISSPLQNSASKRINMFLRWMVRKDAVDFGIWKKIKPSQLVCPLDLHVSRVAKRFGLISRPNADWQSALELTENLKKMDSSDPVKYDFALFSLGAIEKY